MFIFLLTDTDLIDLMNEITIDILEGVTMKFNKIHIIRI